MHLFGFFKKKKVRYECLDARAWVSVPPDFFLLPRLDLSGGKKGVLLIFERMSGVCVYKGERALITPSSPTPRASISQGCVIIVSTHPPKHPVNLNQKEHTNTSTHTNTHTHTKLLWSECVLSSAHN